MAKILLVEDDVENANFFAKYLIRAGHDVTVRYNGEEAWELLKKGQPWDMVVTDGNMPKLDGWDLLKWIRASPTRVKKVVLISAQGADKNFDGNIPKPFTREELVDGVNQILGESP